MFNNKSRLLLLWTRLHNVSDVCPFPPLDICSQQHQMQRSSSRTWSLHKSRLQGGFKDVSKYRAHQVTSLGVQLELIAMSGTLIITFCRCSLCSTTASALLPPICKHPKPFSPQLSTVLPGSMRQDFDQIDSCWCSFVWHCSCVVDEQCKLQHCTLMPPGNDVPCSVRTCVSCICAGSS